MDLQLSNIENAPRTLPIWELILEDLGNPSARQIAKALDVGTSTVHRWGATQRAPRVACLALFWLTRWGRSQVDAQAVNDARAAVGLLRALTEERDTLRHRLAALEGQRQVHATSPANVLAEAFAGLLKQAEEQRTAAFWQALGTGAAEAQKSQIETNWKVLLEPSHPQSATPAPASALPAVRRYVDGRQVKGPPGAAPPPGPAPHRGAAAARPSPDAAPALAPQAPETARSVFGSMVASVTHGGARKNANTGSAGRATGMGATPPSAHAANGRSGPTSLPLADQKDARPGTPASASGLRPYLGARPQTPGGAT